MRASDMFSNRRRFTRSGPEAFLAQVMLTVLCCGVVLGAAAPPESRLPDELVVRSWRTQDGLPHNTVNSIVQARDGYLWIGTRDGLARFDGVRFSVFGLKEGLPSVEVQTLYEDRQGTLWIGTSGGGLSRWKEGQIETVTFPQHLAANGTVSSLAENAASHLWIGTRAGLTIAEHGRFANEGDLGRLGQIGVRALLPDHADGMWIATLSDGLYEYRSNRLQESKGPAGIERILAYCLLEDSRSNLWASIGNGTLLCRQNGNWTAYTETNGLPFAYITCLAEDHAGVLWAGSLDDGLYCLSEGTFQPVRQQQGLSANDVRALCVDRDGNLWVGTRTGGLNRLTRRKLISVGIKQGLTNDYTRAVAESSDGTLWVGTTGGGLYRGTLQGGFSSFAPFHSTVESVLAGPDGTIWWGAARGFLCQQNGQILFAYTNEPWLGPAAVTALCHDEGSGVWVGTTEGRLVHYQKETFTEVVDPLARGPITGLVQQRSGAIWVGSMAGGLQRVSFRPAKVEPVKEGLASQAIRTLYLDSDEVLWIGTAGGGLCRWDSGRAFTFTPNCGFVANTVVQIVEDNNGFLWLGTSRGVLRVRKSELSEVAAGRVTSLNVRSFGVNEGMPAEECSSGFCPAGLKTRSGLVCISTVKGLVFFDPKDQGSPVPPPKAIIGEIVVNGELRQPKSTPLRTPSESADSTLRALSAEDSMVLSAKSRELEFRYTAIDFTAPEKVRFRYQLAGYDSTWFEAGEGRVATYHRVPPGNYVFRVMASNADGAWSSEATTLALIVPPYWWETSWFIGFSVVCGLLLVAAIIRLFERQRYRRRLVAIEARHAVERERLRISRDMHDDVGSILTQVSQLSDLGQSDSGGPSCARPLFERIGSQSRAAVQALDEIVWATNPQNDNLPRFAEYISQFADELFQNSAVRCWQEVPTTLPNIPLTADLRHNIFLALKEAFNNVLKHAEATEVWVRLVLDESEITVSVEDNGKGFNANGPGCRGNGLENMQARLAECGGKAKVVSSPGKGTCVSFCFPTPKSGENGKAT